MGTTPRLAASLALLPLLLALSARAETTPKAPIHPLEIAIARGSHLLPRPARSFVLKSISARVRDRLYGRTAFRPELHDTGPAFRFDASTIAPGAGFSTRTAWAMALAAKRAYEPLGGASSDPRRTPAVADLAAQGYSIRILGSAGGSTQGYVAVKGAVAIVALRGTEPGNVRDLRADAALALVPGYGGRVHQGFRDAIEEVWGELASSLREARASLPAGTALHVLATGHSLGAALATLAAKRIAEELPEVARVDGVYAFGSPRVLDGQAALAYSRVLGDRTYRFCKSADVVPQVPLEQRGYRHVGLRMVINRFGKLRPGHGGKQLLLDRLAAILGGGGLAKLAEHRLEPQMLWDHSVQGYVGHLFKNRTVQVDLAAARAQMLSDYLAIPSLVASDKVQLALAPLRQAEREALLGRIAPDSLPRMKGMLRALAAGDR